MQKTHHIIFLPGLGDHIDHGQTKVLKLWRRPGFSINYHQIGWADNSSFESKLRLIVSSIDNLRKQGHEISLVGVSAGASAALNAYIQRPSSVNSVVYICGKLNNPQTVAEYTYRKNPVFRGSMRMLNDSLGKLTAADKAKMLAIHPIYEPIVPVPDAKIPGVRSKRVPSIGHVPTIAIVMLFYGRYITNFTSLSSHSSGIRRS